MRIVRANKESLFDGRCLVFTFFVNLPSVYTIFAFLGVSGCRENTYIETK